MGVQKIHVEGVSDIFIPEALSLPGINPFPPYYKQTDALGAVLLATLTGLPANGSVYLNTSTLARTKTASYVGGAPGDTALANFTVVFKIVNGTITNVLSVGGTWSPAGALTTELGATRVTFVISGQLIQIFVPGLTAPSIVDWEFGLQSGSLVLTEG